MNSVSSNAADAMLEVINPRTGEVDYRIRPPSLGELAATCTRLRSGQPAWWRAGVAARAAVLRRWADEIERDRDAISEAECLDTGRYRLSRESPGGLVATLHAWADKAPAAMATANYEGTSSAAATIRYRTHLVPFELVGIISPWNFPLAMSLVDAVPALLAGCAVIVKPSEVAPRFVEPLRRTLARVPELASVLEYAVGGPDTGRALIDAADAVCFTGSVATGRQVAEHCARQLKPVFLELGGKDPAIVTADADLDRAADAVLRGAVFATGQMCFSIERVYVQSAVHDDFVSRLVERCLQVQLNYPDIHAGHIGPFILPRQAQVVDAQIDDALARGARLRTGGKSQRLGGGCYMRPTVLTDVTHDMVVMQEETFGPVIPVMRYGTIDEAVTLANDSVFGLSAAVIAASEAAAAAIGERLHAGGVSLQDTTLNGAVLRDAEKTSFKYSGVGPSRIGPRALTRFLRQQALISNAGACTPLRNLGEPTAPSS
jgi:acyl-CoA reductase-like NAD-dependent aldehyde dehydrogenase